MDSTSVIDTRGPKVKYPYVGNTRWNFMKWADIESARYPGYTYLRRLRIIQTPWFAVYLHFIFEEDSDRDAHDHPFTFWSFICRGAYHEYLYDPTGSYVGHGEKPYWSARRHRRFSLHKMPTRLAHKIMWIKPGTVTLIFAGPKKRKWGFWVYETNEFVPWEEYNRRKATAS